MTNKNKATICSDEIGIVLELSEKGWFRKAATKTQSVELQRFSSLCLSAFVAKYYFSDILPLCT